MKEFSELNAYIEEKLRDTSLYTTDKFSFLKILQHALSYSEKGLEQKIIRNYFHLPFQFHVAILYLKAGMRKSTSPFISKQILVIEDGRTYTKKNGEVVSHFFSTISEIIGREKITTINNRADSNVKCDYQRTELMKVVSSPDAAEVEMLKAIYQVIARLKDSGHFSADEMNYVRSCFHIFYDAFQFWHGLLKSQQINTCLFCTHYHNEGLIAALKVLGIKSIEVQHGLISANDIYYVYPKVFSAITEKAFFPDRIFLFGDYWKKMLERACEWKPDALVVAGDYQFSEPNANGTSIPKENLILIAAQKNAAKEYVAYALQLAQIIAAHAEWRVVVKLHPLEKELAVYEALKVAGIEIADSTIPLSQWFQKSRIQVSIYSTTFYDALGYDVVNYSIQDLTFRDYAMEMVKEGVALPISMNDDVVANYYQRRDTGWQPLDRMLVYALIEADVIRKEVLGN